MKQIFTIFLITTSILSFSQNNISNQDSSYQIFEKFPFYNYCKKCKIKENRPKTLCGHNYKVIFLGYSNDGNNWTEIGLAKDRSSCFPDIGSKHIAISYSILVNNNIINSFKLTYLKDNLFGLQFYFLKYGLNIEAISDFQNTDLALRPEIRIVDNMDYNRFLSRINIGYGFNINLNNYFKTLKQNHQITLIYSLFKRGGVS